MRLSWLLFLLLSTAAAEHHVEVLDHSICAPDGVALGGYDPVSYRQSGGPVQGESRWSADHDGVTYRFISEDNRDVFSASPEKYLPRYRGWCAATLAMGALACPDYTNFKIENGELLLFEIVGFTNGRDMWDSDPAGNRRSADGNFTRLMHE